MRSDFVPFIFALTRIEPNIKVKSTGDASQRSILRECNPRLWIPAQDIMP